MFYHILTYIVCKYLVIYFFHYSLLCGSVRLDSGVERRQVRCLSCSLGGAGCQYVSAQFSRSALYYVLGCLGPSVPTYRLRSTADDTGNQLTRN